MKVNQFVVAIVLFISFAALAKDAATLPLKAVKSGKAILRQTERLTSLEVQMKDQTTLKIPLVHKTALVMQGTNSPYEAKVVAEIPGSLLIFTDTFASNPGNIQGQCGASETGERFIHVVSLAQPAHETFTLLIDSCLSGLVPAEKSPKVNLTDRTITISFEERDDNKPLSTIYHISADNEVTPSP